METEQQIDFADQGKIEPHLYSTSLKNLPITTLFSWKKAMGSTIVIIVLISFK